MAVEVGHTDTDDTTVLHVPSIGLVVAGDVAYNGVHQYLLESAHGGVEAWLAALDKVAALQPRAVVAGHKNKDLPDDPAIIDQTRDYLLNARRLLAEKPSPREYFDEMIALYPDRLNVGPVWYTAVALLPETTRATSSIRDEVDALVLRRLSGHLDRRRRRNHPARARVHPRLLVRAPALERRTGQSVVSGRACRGGRARSSSIADCVTRATHTPRYPTGGFGCTTTTARRSRSSGPVSAPTEPRSKGWPRISRWRAGPQGWRILSIQAVPTTSDSLKTVWPQAI